MSNYEFQTGLYNSPSQMCAAIAMEWLSAGGLNSQSDIENFLSEMTDEQLSDECIAAWGLDQPETILGIEDGSWMSARDTERSDLVRAFADVRGNAAEVFGWPVRVNVGGQNFDVDAVIELMDDDLREELHSAQEWASEQTFVDAYCTAHAARFGAEFVVN